jgi:hypothetical protein
MFKVLVIAIAVLVLMASLGWFAYEIHNNKTVPKAYPPTFSSCPDYWEKDGSGRCIVPLTRNAPFSGGTGSAGQRQLSTNTYDSYLSSNPGKTISQFYFANPGYTPGYTAAVAATSSGSSPSPATIDFSAPAWKEYGTAAIKGSTDCIWREWANRVGVTWDGITNYNQC